MGILHLEGGGKNPSLHIDGENLWGRVALHFGKKLEEGALQGKKYDSFPMWGRLAFQFGGKKA